MYTKSNETQLSNLSLRDSAKVEIRERASLGMPRKKVLQCGVDDVDVDDDGDDGDGVDDDDDDDDDDVAFIR